jgi:drug efflux transport system ATP-binding protein
MRETVAVQNLTKRFGEFTAVDDVSFSVHEGEIFGFLGPNGAGKTTTIKMLTGLLHPTSGTGHVAEIPLGTASGEIKERIGYMSQLFSLYADLTVMENIALFGGLYGVRGTRFQARTAWLLEMAGLTRHRRTLTGDLPLGWKQRLALGCAVLHEPSVLFLDEPTSGVDPLARRAFWDLIDDLASQGTTVLVSTHYMEEAEYCHRLSLMNRGRLIALDTPAALREGMHQPILGLQTDNPAGAVEVLQTQSEIVEASMFGRAVHIVVRDEAQARRDVPEFLAGHGINCRELRRVPPSLEDVFVARIREGGGVVIG